MKPVLLLALVLCTNAYAAKSANLTVSVTVVRTCFMSSETVNCNGKPTTINGVVTNIIPSTNVSTSTVVIQNENQTGSYTVKTITYNE